MTEENKTYIMNLTVADVPWHRLTTAYGRGTDFPTYFKTLWEMDDLDAVKSALYELQQTWSIKVPCGTPHHLEWYF